MGKLRKPPKVYKISHRQRSGEITEDDFYSFRVQHEGKRKTIKTEFKNKRRAQDHVNAIFSSEQRFSNLIENYFSKQQDNRKEETPKQNNDNSVLSVLSKDGWLNWETNPKLLNHKKQGKNYGSRHAKNISYALNHIFIETDQYAWFSSKNISSVGRKDAQNLSDELWKHRTYRGVVCEDDPELKETIGSYKAHITALKTFFTYCFDVLNITEVNPFHRIVIPKYRKRKIKPFFSQSQLQMMFDTEYLKTLDSDKQWGTFLESDYYKSFFFNALTGLRSGELRALQWKQLEDNIVLNIDRAFKENTTQDKDVDTPKWGKVRTIILCDSAFRIIKDIEPKNAGEYIFKNSVGKAIDSSTWKKKFGYFISVLNDHSVLFQEDYTPHSFRGTLNSLLISQGIVSGPLIRKYLGWSENNTLTAVQEHHYTKLVGKDMFTVARGIEELFSGRKMQWEYISKSEKEELKHLLPNWQYLKNKMLQNQGSSSSDMKTLIFLKNSLFKELNNYILFDSSLTEEERQILISHCKYVLKMEFMTIDTLDLIFSSEFKNYLSKTLKYLPASKEYVITLILDFFATQLERDQKNYG